VGETPDAAAVVAAVAELHRWVQDVFGTGRPPAGDAAEWSRIAGAAQQIDTRARWCRDATLAIAHRAGASWSQLERDTGVADSTLDSRLKAFLRSEGVQA
jgi:hypothetical protein